MIEDFLSVLSDVNGLEKKLDSVIFLDFLVCVANNDSLLYNMLKIVLLVPKYYPSYCLRY